MSTVTDHDCMPALGSTAPSTATAATPLPVTNPADGRGVRRGRRRHGGGRRRRRPGRAAARSREWSRSRVSKRGEILGKAAHHVEQHVDELVALLTREQGKTLRDARIEVTKAIDTLMHYVGLSKALRGAHTPNLDPGVDGIVLRRPLGVVGAIVPWNFPTTLLSNKLAPALVAGNTVVAKPAGTTPLTTLRFAELLVEGGLPRGRVQRRHRQRLGRRHRARHPSGRAEDRLHRLDAGRASRSWRWPPKGTKRVTLELGGSDPMIICDDADLAARGQRRVDGPLLQLRPGVPGDQARVRVRVGRRRGDRGDHGQGQAAEGRPRRRRGLADGPAAHRRAARRGRRPGRAHARAGRRRSLAGGAAPDDPELADGFFYQPTVVVDPPHDSPMATEEVFGPALPIWRVADFEEAIERANASQFGLGSSVWTRDLAPRAPGRRADRGRLHLDQLPHQGLRRAALRRLEVVAATARSTARRRSTTTRRPSPW